MGLGQSGCHCAAQAAHYVVVLRCHHAAADARPVGQGRLVQRFPAEAVQHRSGNAPLFQHFGGFHGLGHHDARSGDAHVLALPQHRDLAQLKGGALLVDAHRIFPQHADVVDAVSVLQHADHLFQLHGIAGLDQGDLGDAHQAAHIFKGHVGAAVVGCGNTGVRAHDAHVLLAIGAGNKDLIHHPAGGKGGEGVGEGHHAGGGKAGGHAHHVGFLDAAVHRPVREFFEEGAHARRADQVGIQHADAAVLPGHLAQGLAVDGPHLPLFVLQSLFHLIAHLTPPPTLCGLLPALSPLRSPKGRSARA